jgi:hypothetical protein
MAIIISENGKNARRIDESQFGLEDKLQQYIYDNPDAIPLYDIDEDTRLFIAAREFTTKSGPIDALGFDANGNIYVVETKLYKNHDKRTVVAQALDYGASLWRHSVDFENFILQLDSHCQKQFGASFKEKYCEFFELEESTENFNDIRTNLAEGSIKFVVLMDRLHDALKDLVVFVNQNSKFDLYAVELEYYRHKSFEIIIPKLYGAEVKKDVTSASSRNNKPVWNQSNKDELIESLDNNFKVGVLGEAAYTGVKKLIQLYDDVANLTGGQSSYWHVKYHNKESLKYFLNDPEDRVTLCLESDGRFAVYRYNKDGVQVEFINNLLEELILNKILRRTPKHRDGTQWFLGLDKTYASDQEVQQFVESNIKAFESLKNNATL